MIKTILWWALLGMLAILPRSVSAQGMQSLPVFVDQSIFLDIQSTTDGNGNFFYTFQGSPRNPDFAFYFTSGSGTITIPSFHGVQSIQAPTGWQGAVVDNVVTFQYAGSGGVWLSPSTIVTFGITSIFTESEIQNSRGNVHGPFTLVGNPSNGGTGDLLFSYITALPEPTPMTLFAVGTVSLALAARNRRNRDAAHFPATVRCD